MVFVIIRDMCHGRIFLTSAVGTELYEWSNLKSSLAQLHGFQLSELLL